MTPTSAPTARWQLTQDSHPFHILRVGDFGGRLIGITAELVGLRPALVTILLAVLVIAIFASLVRDTTYRGTVSLG